MIMTDIERGEATPPLFVMRTGLIYSSPFGFFDDLADCLDAHVIVPDDIRQDFIETHDVPEGLERSAPVREMTRIIAEEQVIRGLEQGHNVVYEGLLNQVERRQQLREVADSCGALTLLIATRSSFDDISKRIHQRANGEIDGIGPEDQDWIDRKLFAYHSLKKNIEWPDDEPSLSLRCDFDRDNEELIQIVEKRVEVMYSKVTESCNILLS